jgi:CRP/FNR family transcriptional regulator, nitrogen oxide reductase regulator
MNSLQSSPLAAVDLERLAAVSLFSGLTRDVLQTMLQKAQSRQAAEDSFFFFQGDPADYLFVLISGRIKLSQTGFEGEAVLMRVIGPYTLFGAVAMTPSDAYPVSAQASEDCVAITWRKQEMMAFVRQYPDLALNAVQVMAQHTQEFQERFRQLATERVERRLARTLLRLASQTGRKIPQGVLIDMPLTRQDLAEMTGTTLFTVSRLLKQWQDKGLVLSRRASVIICYPHGLVAIAEDLSQPNQTSK